MRFSTTASLIAVFATLKASAAPVQVDPRAPEVKEVYPPSLNLYKPSVFAREVEEGAVIRDAPVVPDVYGPKTDQPYGPTAFRKTERAAEPDDGTDIIYEAGTLIPYGPTAFRKEERAAADAKIADVYAPSVYNNEK